MSKREFKDDVYHQFSRIGKVLSSPKRLELLDLLSQGPKSVEVLSTETCMSVANTSKHLQALLEARLVLFQKEKNYVIYQLSDQSVVELLLVIRKVAEKQLAELSRLRNDFIVKSNPLEYMTLDEFVNRYNGGGITLIDVRSREEYDAGHIAGAVSMPFSEMDLYINDLSKDGQIVAYCRGPYCLLSKEAVELLQAKGYNAMRLEAGLHEWKQAQAFPHGGESNRR